MVQAAYRARRTLPPAAPTVTRASTVDDPCAPATPWRTATPAPDETRAIARAAMGASLADPIAMRRARSRSLLAQGLYYVATGAWPFVHLKSFERVTGPKYEIWLVRAVGALAAAIGVTLVRASRTPSRDARGLARASALAFAAIDVAYAARRRISPIYLADAAFELGFLAGAR